MSMSSTDLTAVTSGISSSLTFFYTVGGTILVVMASIWGFKKITGLLSPEWSQRGYSSQSDMDENLSYFADKHDSDRHRDTSEYAQYRYERRFGNRE